MKVYVIESSSGVITATADYEAACALRDEHKGSWIDEYEVIEA